MAISVLIHVLVLGLPLHPNGLRTSAGHSRAGSTDDTASIRILRLRVIEEAPALPATLAEPRPASVERPVERLADSSEESVTGRTDPGGTTDSPSIPGPTASEAARTGAPADAAQGLRVRIAPVFFLSSPAERSAAELARDIAADVKRAAPPPGPSTSVLDPESFSTIAGIQPVCGGFFDASDCGLGATPQRRAAYRLDLRARREIGSQLDRAELLDRARIIRLRRDSIRDTVRSRR